MHAVRWGGGHITGHNHKREILDVIEDKVSLQAGRLSIGGPVHKLRWLLAT